MIIPSRWMTGGKGLDEFRSQMINDKRFTILHDFPKCKECFYNVDIEGGVCFFLWDKDHNGKCSVITHSTNGDRSSNRYLKEEGCDIYIRDEILISIMKKKQKTVLKKLLIA